MVIAYHLVLTAYGFWLPNDPRGSWSEVVRATELRAFGPATKVNTKQSRAGATHDRAARDAAKRAMKYPAVRFNGTQARAVARGIGEVVTAHQLSIHAAAVMPDHVHLVVARHGALTIEGIGRRIKAKATQRLNAEGIGVGRSPWARGQWSVFLRDAEAVRRTVRYVEQNPVRAGLKKQDWKFVTFWRG
ncbi:MAG: transposase [Planctomycetota bacterium]